MDMLEEGDLITQEAAGVRYEYEVVDARCITLHVATIEGTCAACGVAFNQRIRGRRLRRDRGLLRNCFPCRQKKRRAQEAKRVAKARRRSPARRKGRRK